MDTKLRLKVMSDGTLEHVSGTLPLSVGNLKPFSYTGQNSTSPWENSLFDGDKFLGGFGNTQVQEVDYWTLRARSSQLFNENIYAKGIIRRLVTNEINTGLCPEACPDESILGLAEGSLNDWTENVETRFNIWAKNPKLCDWLGVSTFGAMQRAARQEALISGDVLVVIRHTSKDNLPKIQLVMGNLVRTPLAADQAIPKSHKIKHGVELNAKGMEVAYWVDQEDGGSKRISKVGASTGRTTAYLLYGTNKRLDELRGQPILAVVTQSLKEIDRYRDSTQRKAVMNSTLAGFIKKTEDKMSSLPMTGGATRVGKGVVEDSDGTKRNYNISNHIPGLFLEELQTGEEPVLLGGQGTDVNFGEFEESIIQAVSWCLELPPEILRLSFSNNYSASQAAINEFKIAINRTWGDFGETFCTPIYVEWLLSETLLQKIASPGLLEAWRSPSEYDKFGAWTSTDWYGAIKPSTDMLKQAKASRELIDLGLTTRAREARVTTGTKYSKNMRRQKRENELLVEANRPLAEFRKEFGIDVAPEEEGPSKDRKRVESVIEGHLDAILDDYLDDRGG